MSINGAPQQGAAGEEHPAWFTAYLQSLSIKREEVRAVELDNVLQTCEDVSEVFRNNISAAYRTESKLEAARQAEREALSQTILQTPVVYSVPYEEFPWSLITPEQGKICSRLSEDLIPLDFSSRSIKSWIIHFNDVFSKKFVVDPVAKLSVIYNSCSTPLQQQILSMDIGSKAQKEEFLYQELLQIICVLANLPNHQELALQQLYAGIKQASADSVTVFLEKIRNLAEDSYGLASTWTVNQTSTVIQKVVGGLRNKDLA